VRICLNSGDVKIKYVRTTYDGRITGLVEDFGGTWGTGYNYRLRNAKGNEFLAELVEIESHNDKTRLTFEK